MEKSCFVVAPIGDEDSATRRRSDQVLNYIIAPALEPLGYNVTRADKIAEPGIINSQVIQHIVDDDLIVADLTDINPNVFYELAIRHSIRKPFIQIMLKNQKIPFDVAGQRTIFFDNTDLDSVESAKSEIVDQAKALDEATDPVESPISVSFDLQLLKQSGDPSDRSIGDILDQITGLKRDFAKLSEIAVESFVGRKNNSHTRAMLSKLRHQLHSITSLVREAQLVREQIEKTVFVHGNEDESRLALKLLRLLDELESMVVNAVDLTHITESM